MPPSNGSFSPVAQAVALLGGLFCQLKQRQFVHNPKDGSENMFKQV